MHSRLSQSRSCSSAATGCPFTILLRVIGAVAGAALAEAVGLSACRLLLVSRAALGWRRSPASRSAGERGRRRSGEGCRSAEAGRLRRSKGDNRCPNEPRERGAAAPSYAAISGQAPTGGALGRVIPASASASEQNMRRRRGTSGVSARAAPRRPRYRPSRCGSVAVPRTTNPREGCLSPAVWTA